MIPRPSLVRFLYFLRRSFARRRFRLVTPRALLRFRTPSVFPLFVSFSPFLYPAVIRALPSPSSLTSNRYLCRTLPFRASSKAIRMATSATYTKTANFFVVAPVFCPGLYRSCSLCACGRRAFSRAVVSLATSSVPLYFVHRCPLLHCLCSLSSLPHVVIMPMFCHA